MAIIWTNNLSPEDRINIDVGLASTFRGNVNADFVKLFKGLYGKDIESGEIDPEYETRNVDACIDEIHDKVNDVNDSVLDLQGIFEKYLSLYSSAQWNEWAGKLPAQKLQLAQDMQEKYDTCVVEVVDTYETSSIMVQCDIFKVGSDYYIHGSRMIANIGTALENTLVSSKYDVSISIRNGAISGTCVSKVTYYEQTIQGETTSWTEQEFESETETTGLFINKIKGLVPNLCYAINNPLE